MTRDEAKAYILLHGEEILERDKSKKGFICPICGSGSGSKGTGITKKDETHYTCWAGCFTCSDIIDIIGQEAGLTDYNDKLTEACRRFNITIDGKQENRNPVKSEQNTHTHNSIHTKKKTEEREEQTDYTSFFKECNAKLPLTSYRRGISEETLNRYLVGYCENWKSSKNPNAPASPRLIIPTSKYSYLARDTSGDAKTQKMKEGNTHLFNAKALKTSDRPIIITEGEIDALSVIDVGGEAVGLGGVTNVGLLLRTLETVKPKAPLIIALDNDEAGQEAQTKLAKDLQTLKIPFYTENVAEGYKDANEALNANREDFKAIVTWVEEEYKDKLKLDEEGAKKIEECKTENQENEDKLKLDEEREALKKEAVSNAIDSFLEEIEASKTAEHIPTGFPQLDAILDGGLYPGLYVVGAISSLGKTTLALQIADNIAKAGQNVLIFSLEMARNELIAKSVSRLTVIEDLKDNTTDSAKTTRGIMNGSRYAGYSEIEKGIIKKAIAEYRSFAGNIFITEGVGNIGVEQIKEKVEAHTRITGKAPVVIIDYLQILAPYSERMTDKQNTDKAVLELKRLSRDKKIPVIGISSFNRENYLAPVNLTSFKESGAIEYSSDVLLALQYDGMDYKEGESEKERDKRIRTLIKTQQEKGKNGEAQALQIKILKNRNGSKGESNIGFYPMFNYFTEDKLTVWHTATDADSFDSALTGLKKKY